MKANLLSWSVLGFALACATASDAAAAENPQQRVGIEHNLYLDCLMRAGGGTIETALRTVVERCGFDPGMPVDAFVASYAKLLDGDPFLDVTQRMTPYRDLYTDDQFAYFARIDAALASAASPAEADRALAALEQEAVARYPGRDDAEASLLALLSTARYSLAYWSASGAMPQSAGGGFQTAKLKWWHKVLIVVGADAAGAGIGLLFGGPVGAGAVGAGASTGVGTAIKDN